MSSSNETTLESLKYEKRTLKVIDQLRLPTELVYIDVKNSEDAWTVIRTMQVRGAPLIAIVACLGLVAHVESVRSTLKTTEAAVEFLVNQMDYLRTSRPTAVNLFVATDALTLKVKDLGNASGASAESVIDGYIHFAEKMLEDDIATNKSIGDHGAKKIIELVGRKNIKVLTICNTGSLATAGYGTALGVIRSLHALGYLGQVYACETRPYNQGARLTAFEIVSDNLPGTLITDSMASYLMSTKGIDCVVVGADRVAANGDTANKIGTYQLAITAKFHEIPFFTAVPTTTLDLTISSGSKIHVEERPPHELTTMFNQKIAPDGINVWNPSFDVTPCSLITGVITEVGVAEANPETSGGIIDITSFLREKGLGSITEKAVTPIEAPIGYKSFNDKTIGDYVLSFSNLRDIIGDKVVNVIEVGDGNLNFVYIVTGSNGNRIVVKQALPYVRCVGESWPLTLNRAYFESKALKVHRKYAQEYVPEVYFFDKTNSVIVMQYIEPPHLILRKKLIEGERIESFARHVANFSARTLFSTSLLALQGSQFREEVSSWSKNTSMCALTEKVIFTDPYTTDKHNHWTTPQLDSYALAIKQDSQLKLAASHYKNIFISSAQALLHGDLHTGSVMVKENSTFVIDPEFAFYGPMGFDIGAFISNLLLNYFSQAGKETSNTDNENSYSNWILQQIVIFYNTFQTDFVNLWDNSRKNNHVSELYAQEAYSSDILFQQAKDTYFNKLFAETLGFTGMKMIRRIVGIAHVADLDSIPNPDIRAICEKRALIFAKKIVLISLDLNRINAELPNGINSVIKLAKEIFFSKPDEEWK